MISVVVPVYNAESFLPQCIDSILHQTYKNIEILLIDDGSTDNSGKICDNYSYKYPCCKVFHQSNKGIASARNTGLHYAKGGFIAFVDDDDWLHPQYLEHLYRAIKEGEYALSLTKFKKCMIQDVPCGNSEIPFSTRIISRDILISGLMCGSIKHNKNIEIPFETVWACLYRRDVLEGEFFQNIIGEDIEYNNRIYQKIDSAVLVPENLYYWIQHTSSFHRNYPIHTLYSWIDCYLLSLKHISPERQRDRGLCLLMLYKRILSIRYIINKYDEYVQYHAEFTQKLKIVKTSHLLPFLKNRYVPFMSKISVLGFLYIPLSYTFFRMVLETRTKHNWR